MPVWKQGLNELHVAEPHLAAPGGGPPPALVESQGALAVSGLKLGHTIVSQEATIPVRDAFASAVSTSLVAKDFSKTFFELNDKPGIQDILFRDADPAQALQGKLLLDDSVGIDLRTLYDSAKQVQTFVRGAQGGRSLRPGQPGGLPSQTASRVK